MAETKITVRHYGPDSEELYGLMVVETSDEREVDLVLWPYTSDAMTVSLSPDQAWALAREVARCATTAEGVE